MNAITEMPVTDLRSGFCIYVNTYFQGPVPVVSEDEKYLIFETVLDAQREIAENQIARLRQFLDGERDFKDAMASDEFVVAVKVDSEGIITDGAGNHFGPEVS